ncbi:tetratricopeptide repeat protein [Aporhodopirellula aestuarii]|uniref:Tetratricopeptide repeat protein n=1 Tax=Aporhodopirellula aestuarii TaxID=2950107 RepID=A0ABT0U6U1_9BACT|nr:hypothetical protein [Aporhodopirellula aestuarii]MCM2372056.1 hypothetical protein [Aporhodopirellula aestuarii]
MADQSILSDLTKHRHHAVWKTVRLIALFCMLMVAQDSATLHAQTESESDPAEPPAIQREVQDVALQLEQETWFTDVVATATVKFPEAVEQPSEIPIDDDVSIFDIEVRAKARSGDAHEAVIRFLPRRTGLSVFPALEFLSDTHAYRSPPTQFIVSAPQRSDEMQFELSPASTTVYAGEPLRVDVTWSSHETTNRFRSLKCFPPFFNDDDLEIVIPRCTAPEERQMGMPFGGRRIIAERVPPDENPNQFGIVRFPMFIRFHEPGLVEIPAVRLECALRNGNGSAFAPYAAYYNNGLFEPLSSLTSYERVYAESDPISIEVLPLPRENRSELFSNLFTPCEIEVSIATDELEVGQVLEVDLRVHSNAPHGMLDLKPLTLQRSLRGRFHVSPEFGRTWYPDGTGFRARVRPLTTDISAFPSLRIPVFDPQSGSYHDLQTQAVSLTVKPHDGSRFFDIRNLTAEPTLTDQPDGIWHNARPTKMTEFMNQMTGILAEHVLLWMACGVVAFAFAFPWVRERRRRAINPVYRAQSRAFHELKKTPEGTIQKWQAFRKFLATGFSMPDGAWTSGDAQQRLRKLDLSEQDIRSIEQANLEADRFEFSAEKPTPSVPPLNELAGRLLAKFRNASTMALLLTLTLLAGNAAASEWSEAESLFEQALDTTPGLPETNALYSQAALKYESAATTEGLQGVAWFNAGNAWFQSGELGRAIACYRQSQIYRPFDPIVRENLRAARALTVDVLDEPHRMRLSSLPLRWICAAMVPLWFLLLGVLLVHERYRNTLTRVSAVGIAAIILVAGLIGLSAMLHSGSEGVVVVGEVYGRKGPAYTYNPAFNEPLHDGLEFHVQSKRDDWLEIELADGRRCWIPANETRLIFNRRS